jgi:hypothetical protein
MRSMSARRLAAYSLVGISCGVASAGNVLRAIAIRSVARKEFMAQPISQ